MGLNIIFEDEYIIVLHKEPFVAVQTAKIGEKDLVSELKKYLGKDAFLGIVHRLDQPVEGVVVFAKTKQAASFLSAQISENSIKRDNQYKEKLMHKLYHADVYGHMPSEEGYLEDYLLKDGRNNASKVVASKNIKDAKLAVLHYRVIERCDEQERLEIELFTGRHHQIRVQLANANCPILGDVKYGTDASKLYSKEQGIRNTSLVAYSLSLIHPSTGKRMEFHL